jgi:lysophospholipase L1-like esterase
VILLGRERDRRRGVLRACAGGEENGSEKNAKQNGKTKTGCETHRPSVVHNGALVQINSLKSDLLAEHLKASRMTRARFARLAGLLLFVLVPLSGTCRAQTAAALPIWVASWTTSEQIPEPPNALPPEALHDATLRQIVHLSIGGTALRVHLSNAFGTAPLHFTAVRIARPLATDGPAIDPATDKALTFAGATDAIVPAGAEFVSDPVTEPVAALSDLAISFHLDDPPARETGHPGSRATSYYMAGDQVGAATFTNPGKVDHWYQLAGVDVLAAVGAGTVVALGDSTTDGHGATTNGNDRWTDALAARLVQAGRAVGVANAGIGGNHLLIDGLGPSALSRIDRDLLAPAGVRWVIVFEGVNDLGGLTLHGEVPAADHAALVARLLAAYQQIIVRAHAHGLRVYGATITPDGGSGFYHPDPLNEADRQAVNAWIRAAGHFDAFIDFDAAVRDPQQPDRLLPAFDCGDHLHPSPAGYHAMANAVPLSLF